MARLCPRCGEPVNRKPSEFLIRNFALLGAILGYAFAGFHCPKCGDIPGSEFSASVRLWGVVFTLLMMVLAAGVIAGVVYLCTEFDF